MLNVTTIAMEEFPLRWRFIDPTRRVLPPGHLEQIKPLDAVSARRVLEASSSLGHGVQPFTHGRFANVEKTSISAYNPDEVQRVRKWLYERGVPFKRQVYLSWDAQTAMMTTWKMLVRYWDAFWYPSSDDLFVFDESLSWALYLWHEEEAFFATGPATRKRSG